jgi:hypothetical protein
MPEIIGTGAALDASQPLSRVRVNALREAWIAIALYAVFRMVFVPADDATKVGFDHDSAYIVQVADNLRSGKGFVLNTHWLVFLNPERLPMPFHNANPLYPVATALMAEVTGASTVRSAAMVAGVSHAALLAAIFWWAGHYGLSVAGRGAVAVSSAFFPIVWEESMHARPDVFCAALTLWSVALLRHGRGYPSSIGAGLLFGLAWLIRSSVVLTVPALVVLLLATRRLREATVRFGLCVAVAVAVASPWLVHTASVWGSPTRSDAGYYLMQDYHAQQFGGSVIRYWHSTEVPRSMAEVIRDEPGAFAAWIIPRIPRTLRTYAHYMIYPTGPALNNFAALLLALAGIGAFWQLITGWRVDRARIHSFLPLIASLVFYTVTTVTIFAIRAESFEVRYLIISSVGLAALITAAGVAAWTDWRRRSSAPSLVVAVLTLILWAVWIPLPGMLQWRLVGSPDHQGAYMNLARRVASQVGTSSPVVTGSVPYFYTLATTAPSLSIPESDDRYLTRYMRRYGARFVLLTREEAAFWRPRWLEPGGLSHPLYAVSPPDDDYLLVELKDGAP